MQFRIPKRIIQTGKTPQQPLRNQAMVSNLRLLNPDYEYMFFDDRQVEEFIDAEFPQYRAVFDSFRVPIQRYDFFRYLAVYRRGVLGDAILAHTGLLAMTATLVTVRHLRALGHAPVHRTGPSPLRGKVR